MLTLVTGTPGAGKTAWTVQELTRLPSQRKVYVHGIPELKIAHEPIYCLSDLCEHCRSLTQIVDIEIDGQPAQRFETLDNAGHDALLVEYWQNWATEGSLIVLDEVQRVWRPSGSKLPDEIAALETHRHKGLDFWLISQGPHLFHSNIRLLIGRHIHLVSTWKGRNEYEFPECRQNVTSRSDAVIRPYSLPKKIFGLYKSASLHTASKHRKPMSFYFLIATVLIAVALGFYATQRFDKRFHSEKEITAAGGAVAQAVAPLAAGSLVSPSSEPIKAFPNFEPVIEGVIESAPAYSELIKVVAAPLLVGCIYSKVKDVCTCYTAQATPYQTSKDYCMLQIANKRFNPYYEINKTPETFKTDKPKPESEGAQAPAPEPLNG